MLEKVIIADKNLSEHTKRIMKLFNKGELLARVIRSLNDLLQKDDLTRVKQDLTTEFTSYKKGINLKHNGKHFATTLILPGKPIQLFHEGLGFLFNPLGLRYKRLCLSDAQDDYGCLGENVITTSIYHEFIELVKKEKPNLEGYCTCNEAQFYLKKENLLGVVVNINKYNEDYSEQSSNNIAAYLKGVAITKFLSREFNLNLFLFIYDQKKGKLFSATRNPEVNVFKLYLNVINKRNCSDLGLDTTESQALTAANKRICSQLNILISENELNEIIKKSLDISIQTDIENTIKSTNENLALHYFPKDGIHLQYSSSHQAYQLILIPRFLNAINIQRINIMIKHLALNLNKISQDEYSITFINEEQLKQLQQYVYCGEDKELYNQGKQAARNEQPALFEI